MGEIIWKKYLIVFFITVLIFATAFYVSNYFSDRRIEEVRAIENKIAIDILSSETQFNLLAESSCKDIGQSSVLSTELNNLAQKLSETEKNLGATNEEVVSLKQYYSLLQIKDYLLLKKVTLKCGVKPVVILYFYSNKGDCDECERTGYVLDYLREQYPSIRVYAFDYNLELSAVQTLISILKVKNELPALIINETAHYKITTLEEFEKLVPELKVLKEEQAKAAVSTTTATTTRKR